MRLLKGFKKGLRMEGLIIYYVDGLITRGGGGGLISGGAYNRKYFFFTRR